MIKKIQLIFALTEKGARDLVKGVLWTALANITLMFPIGLIVAVLKTVVDSLQSGNPFDSAQILKYVGFGILISVLIFITHYIQYAALYVATYSETANRRIRLAEKLRQLPLSFFGEKDLSDLTSTLMADCTSLEQSFSHYIPQLFGASIATILVGIGLFCMDWRMAVSVLWVLPVALVLAIGSRALQDKYGYRNIDKKRAVTDGIQECIETVRELKANDMQEKYMTKIDGMLAEQEKAAVRAELATGSFVSSAQAFLRLGLATAVLTGAGLLVKGQLDFLTYFVFLLAASRLYDPLSIVMMHIGAIFAAKRQIERMRILENHEIQQGDAVCNPKGYDICFDNVTFSYYGEENILKDVSFTAKQGEVTALVGPSGGGKTTASKLAARFWDINKGRITLGGVDISKVDPEALLKNYSIVFQDVVLFHDTILENIRLGRRDATNAEVLKAAKAAQCDEFVTRLPDGYNTVIGENGSTLSGGERQRLSIARAILKDAPVILLDEATASLDAESETKVQSALTKLIKNKTVLIIAHRMRTVAGADKIIVLDNGHVAEMGTPDELIKRNGIYKNMVSLQKESSEWVLGEATV